MLVFPIEKYNASSESIDIKLFLIFIACFDIPETLALLNAL